MIRIHQLVRAGAAALLLSASASAVIQESETPVKHLPWPEDFFAGEFVKLDSACLFEPGEPQLLVLAGDDLILVRDPMIVPRFMRVAQGVVDFTVLPPVEGLSAVAMTTSAGLAISETSDTDGDPTIIFPTIAAAGSWAGASSLDAAAAFEAGGGRLIAGKNGNQVLRATVSTSGEVSDLEPISPGSAVLLVAVGDVDVLGDGVETAFVSSNTLKVVNPDSTEDFSFYWPLGFVDVSRVPGGLDTCDSFAFVANFDYGAPPREILCEIAGNTISNPLYSGPIQIADLDYALIGDNGRADVVCSSSTTDELMVLHGTPQGSALPFSYEENEWFQIPLTPTTLLPYPPTAPKLAADDFDLDGDCDLALAGSYGGARYVSFLRGNGGLDGPVTLTFVTCPVEGCPDQIKFVDLSVDISVPRPSRFTADPNYVDVTVYIRDWDEYSEASVLSPAWIPTTRLPVTNGSTTFTQEDLPLPEDWLPGNTLFYFKVVPLLCNQPGTIVLQSGGASAWVGTTSVSFLHSYVCDWEPDEFQDESCPIVPGAPVITWINRRTVIPPMPTSP